MKKSRKKLLIILAILIVLVVVVVFNLTRDKEKPIVVKTEVVKKDRIVQVVNASGSMTPKTQVKISANVAARIINLAVKEGNTVKTGDLLVELDRAQYEAAYERAHSQVMSSKANRKKVLNELRRLQTLFDNDLVSSAELETIVAQSELAESQVVQAEAMLKQAQDDLDKTRIVAPMNGIVTSVRKEVGEIALGSVFQEDVILIISDMSKMEVKVEVDETDVVSVALGDTARIEIDALPDLVFKGTVSEIAHSATTRGLGTQEQLTNFEVVISVIGQDLRFRPGMSATVDIITDVRDSVLVVPIQALTIRDPLKPEGDLQKPQSPSVSTGPLSKQEKEDVVFVVHHPGEEPSDKTSKIRKRPWAEQRSVSVGISSDTHFEITSGLSAGEEIVIGSYKAISKELQQDSPLKIENTTSERVEK